jgi:DnaJ-class molecular chaperone
MTRIKKGGEAKMLGYTDDDFKYKTCPDCGGCGKEPSSLDYKCFRCHGSGRIKIEPPKYTSNKNKR